MHYIAQKILRCENNLTSEQKEHLSSTMKCPIEMSNKEFSTNQTKSVRKKRGHTKTVAKNKKGVENEETSFEKTSQRYTRERKKAEKNNSGSTSPEEKRPRKEGKIVQRELFVLRGINASDWIDSSDGSQYVPPSTPSSDLIPSSAEVVYRSDAFRRLYFLE